MPQAGKYKLKALTELEIHECDSCGAAVSDPELHTEWHRAHGTSTLTPNLTYEATPMPGTDQTTQAPPIPPMSTEPTLIKDVLNEIVIRAHMLYPRTDQTQIIRDVAEAERVPLSTVRTALSYGLRNGFLVRDREQRNLLRTKVPSYAIFEPTVEEKIIAFHIAARLTEAPDHTAKIVHLTHAARDSAQADWDENPQPDNPTRQVTFYEVFLGLQHARDRGYVNIDAQQGTVTLVEDEDRRP